MINDAPDSGEIGSIRLYRLFIGENTFQLTLTVVT